MHASNGPIAEAAPSTDPVWTDPVETLLMSLKENRGNDAVIRLLDAISRRDILAGSVQDAFRKRGAADLIPDMVHALACFACQHCRSGFDQCDDCQGTGRGEERSQACIPCGGVGLRACDFCGGAGVMTYDSVPRELRILVAQERSRRAVERVHTATLQSLPRSVAPSQISTTRKDILRRNLHVRRDLAVLTNAVQYARQLRHEDPASRKVTCELFRASSRSACSARHLTAKLFTVLAQLSRVTAKISTDRTTQAFEEERASAFEMHARLMSRWSRRRASLFPGH
jgi:hypothetical protein